MVLRLPRYNWDLMRWFWAFAVLLCVGLPVAAQASGDEEVTRARQELSRIEGLVQSGVLPPAQLEKARDAVQDAEDGALLRKSIFQTDLTEEQADALVAAAKRQLDRRQHAYDTTKQLVDAGAAAQISLSPLLVDLDFARKQADLADTRARLAREMVQAAEMEVTLETRLKQAPDEALKIAERFDGNGIFTPQILLRIESAFAAHFGHGLPITADGETAVHRALGFDHRGRVDVGVHPDQPEGVWLREYLTVNHIPFFAFRAAVPGKATGAHIHLGTISPPLAK
jgi:hypothetical protein